MIKNIVFDLGRVLLSFEPKKYLQETFKDSYLCETLFKEIFSSKEWLNLDCGTISKENAVQAFVNRNPNYNKEITHCMNDWHNILTPIESNVNVLRKLKTNGYNLYILSNFHELAFEHVSTKYDFFKLFDGGIISYKVNQLKPNKEIYTTLMNKYDLVPEETLFIDDSEENINSADLLGFNTIHCTDNIDLMLEIDNLI